MRVRLTAARTGSTLCDERPPLLDKVGGGHLDACHLEPKQKKELRETTIHPELIEEAA